MTENSFLKPILLGIKLVGWQDTDVQNWIEKRINQSSAELINWA
ncbi:AlpA family phage regulatory protein [Dyadobacter jiangsuensis]